MLKRLAVLMATLPAGMGVFGVPGASAEPKPRSVTIGAADFSFDAPPSIPGGRVKVTLVNKGAEIHHAVFIKLKPGVDQGTFLAGLAQGGLQSGVENGSFLGGPNGAAPGARASSVQVLSPGDYLLACLRPGPDRIPHVIKGMVQPITIEPAVKQPERAAPKTTKLVLKDYEINPSAKFDGSGTIDIVNRGEELHEVTVGRLQDGKTPQDVIAWGSQPLFVTSTLPQPFDDVDGITPIDVGARSRIDLGQLEPGDYGLFCFLPNAANESHIALGMLYPFSVRE